MIGIRVPAAWLLVCVPALAAAQSSDAPLQDIRAYLRISDRLATGGQVTYAQVPLLRDAGFDTVINLAIADEERNQLEGFHVTEAGMTYLHVPVDWQNPQQGDLDLFFRLMDASKDRRVFVHCFANMRVSAFLYLYRTVHLKENEATARADLEKIWDPASQPQWKAFMEESLARAKRGELQ